MTAAQSWREALESWAIPEAIRRQAPEDPWAFPPSLFEPADTALTISHRRALEALPAGGDVLDIGAGRCAMSLPLRPPARRIIAVDSQPSMLEDTPADLAIPGRWPDVAAQAGTADVVICGHVLYNVADLPPFLQALTRAARRRVVVEFTRTHPRARPMERALWRHFWGIERPTIPTWEDALAVMREFGLNPRVELWETSQRGGFHDLNDMVTFMRRTVCLDPSKDAEVATIVLQHAVERDGRWRLSAEPRHLVTLWWDTGATP